MITAVLRAPTWRVLLPGRVPVFHLPGTAPRLPARLLARDEPDDAGPVRLHLVEGAA
jgi:hypothetical protein